MDFELTEEQLMIQRLARDFARNEVAPHSAEWDEKEEFPLATVKKMGELGFLGLPFPEEYGGGGADYISAMLAIEELARVDTSIAITMAAHLGLGCTPLNLFGTHQQKMTYLRPCLQGKQLWAFGLTESSSGSDAGNMNTHAERQADGTWVINGAKAFITNSGTAMSGGVTVTAVTGHGAKGTKEITAFIVPQNTPGYTRSKGYRKLGWRASDTHELYFDTVVVPEENVLGTVGEGYKQFLNTLAGGRVGMGALSVGLAQGCLDAALAYAKQRTAFGQNIAKFQAIQFKLADMATQIEVARLMVYKAAWLRMTGQEHRKEASMCKLFASEVSTRAAVEAVQIFGGMGFTEETPVARYFRDCKINEIGEGTSEVQRMLIARYLGC